jgi:hypothetical protein
MKIGDPVRIVRLPDNLPDHEILGTRALFADCLGRVFPIVALDRHLFELHVGQVRGEPACMHSIWIETDCVEPG